MGSHREQRDRDHDRAPGQQHRDARRDQRAEHREQQDQRDRHRGELGLVEVLAHQRVGGLVGARVACLGHGQAGMSGLDPGHRGLVPADGRVGTGVRAGHVERHQGCAAVGRDQRLPSRTQRGPDVPGRMGQPPERPDHVGDCGPQLRAARVGVPGGGAPGLDDDAFLGRADHVQPVQHLLGLAGLPRVVLLLALRAQQLAGQQGRPGQHQPAHDHRDPVPRAPARDPLDHRRPGPARDRRRPRRGGVGGRGVQLRQRRSHSGQGWVKRVAHRASGGSGRDGARGRLN
jgi:hypothetical protein